MSTPADFLEWPVYGLEQPRKEAWLLQRLNALTHAHAGACEPYARVLRARGQGGADAARLQAVPSLPVRLFKHHLLRSVAEDEVFKVLASSGTTGQTPSRICLDRRTAALQTKALVRIVSDFIGRQRLPMLLIDHEGVVRDRRSFSARGAGILGLSNFGRDHTYALDEDMSLNLPRVQAFLERHAGQPMLVFGFTFMVWQHFVRALEDAGLRLPMREAVLLHSGGWKRLADQAVDNATFKRRLTAVTAMERVHNFYGMVEQVGSVFVECEHGSLHAPAFADVIVRRLADGAECAVGEPGVLQVLSALPESYPGHSLLTEDLGRVLGVDDCACGRKGKRLEVHGRLPRAELRGCSDTAAAPVHEGVPADPGNGHAAVAAMQVVLPAGGSLQAVQAAPNLEPFGAPQLNFAGELSQRLAADARVRRHPELVALAYWLRPAHLMQLRARLQPSRAQDLVLPRGLVFHVPPANVDTVFAYAWLLSLLCGNRNVVRLSGRSSPQSALLLSHLAAVLEAPAHRRVCEGTLMVRYGHDPGLSALLSACCDVRMVWGGDATVRALRAVPLQPLATELSFADRVSLALLGAAGWLQATPAERDAAARRFGNDAYGFGQRACSSPRSVVWWGEAGEVAQARADFWHRVEQALAAQGTVLADVEIVNKRVALDDLAIRGHVVADAASCGVVARGWMAQPRMADERHEGGGLFLEAGIRELGELLPWLSRKVQTLSHFGVPEAALRRFVATSLPAGIDRVVPLGTALEFDTVWDGTELLRGLSRQVAMG